jgi:tetratricopeptide (TPR) repeat protein
MTLKSRVAVVLILALGLPLHVVPPAAGFTPSQIAQIKKIAFSKGRRMSKDEANAIFEYASELEEKDPQQAIALLKAILTTEHASARVCCRIAGLYGEIATMGKSSSKNAQQYYQKALVFDPDCSLAYAGLAELELIEGNKEAALRYAQKGVSTKRVDESSYLMLADVLCANKKYKEALAVLEKSERLGNTGGEVLRVKAGCLENLGRYDDAVKAYKQSYALQQKDWTAFQIVRCLETQKKYGEAIAQLNSIIKANPQDGEAFRLRAGLKLKNNDKQSALKDMNICVELEPTSKIYKERAKLHRAMGHEELARKDLQAADKLLNSPF